MEGHKTGGRKKGTPNKQKPSQQIIHGILTQTVGEYFESDEFAADMAQLEPKDRLMVMERLAQYILPKQQAQKVEMNATANVAPSFAAQLRDLAAQYESPSTTEDQKE